MSASWRGGSGGGVVAIITVMSFCGSNTETEIEIKIETDAKIESEKC